MIKNFNPRLYQETIFATAVLNNTLVVLPTGLGKTNLALMLAAQRLKTYPNSKILILACTKPLVNQHYKTFVNHLDNDKLVILNGLIKPKNRKDLWLSNQIIISTPQTIENDLISKRITLEDVSLLVIDEAHRSVGDFAYVYVAKQYERYSHHGRILALTASPGSTKDHIKEVCDNLYIEKIEFRDETNPEVKPYVHKTNIHYEEIDLPSSFKSIKKYLEDSYNSKLIRVKEKGLIKDLFLTKTELLKLNGLLQLNIRNNPRDFDSMKSISLIAEALKIQHAIELIETQGISALENYFEKLRLESIKTKTKATKNLMIDPNFKSAMHQTSNLATAYVEHPKLYKLKEIISKNKDKKIIVFTQYRDSGLKIVDELNEITSAELFVGQAKKRNSGLTQKEQIAMIDSFRNGEFNVLVSSSVGEEGLDIPQVDLVIFYEPVPSAIRSIQRRGRTSRHDDGRVIILMTKNTRDQAYRWASFHKEKRMYRILKDFQKEFSLSSKVSKPKTTLNDFISSDITIYCDHREKGSAVIKQLLDDGVDVQLTQLSVGDYILSDRICVEFKNQDDFLSSILDGRLLNQLKNMSESYPKPLIIVEGDRDLFSLRNIHPNAIRGMIASINLSYGFPIIYTQNAKDTAEYLKLIAKKEQSENTSFSPRTFNKPLNTRDLQEYIISTLPGIGGTLNKPLLKHFKSIKNIANSSVDELIKIKLIGTLKAKQIYDLFNQEYSEF